MQIATADCTLHVEVCGTGSRSIVFVHGLGGSAESWTGVWEPFAATRRAVRLDLRGCGRSQRGTKPYTLEVLGEDVVAVLDHLGIGRCHLVGHSFGGVIVQELLTSHLDRVESAVLVSTSSKVGQKARDAWLRLASAVEHNGVARAAQAQANGFAPDFAAAHPETVDFHAQITKRCNPKVYAEQARAASSYDYTEALKAVRCPVLILQGLADRLTPPGGSVILSRAIPGAELHMIEGVGHNAHIEMGDRFAALLEDFFARAERTSTAAGPR